VAMGRGDHGWGLPWVGMTMGVGVMLLRYKVNMKCRKDDMVELKNNHMKCVHCE